MMLPCLKAIPTDVRNPFTACRICWLLCNYSIFISLQLVDYLDPDGKGFVTKEYVQNLSVDQMKEVLLFIDPTDVSNTEELEYSHIDAGYIE